MRAGKTGPLGLTLLAALCLGAGCPGTQALKRREGPKHVLHPRKMHRYGTILFDSGQRNGEPDD